MSLSLPLTALAQQPAGSLPNKQTGVGVFGQVMGIHADTLGIWGDLVLDSADVTGTGVLSLRGHSPTEPARPQRIVAQHSQVQRLHLASPGKTILLGDLRIEKSLTIEIGVFDASAGKLDQSPHCQTQLLRGGRLQNIPAWTVQSTDAKTRLTNPEQLVGLAAEQSIRLTAKRLEQPKETIYRLANYPLPEADNPAPPPERNAGTL